MKKILITGVNGFIASQLIDKLSDNYQLYGLDISENEDPRLERFIQSDITDKAELKQELRDYNFDLVIHCAAIAHNDDNKFSEEDFFKVNYQGTKNLVDVLEMNSDEIEKFIFFSTVAVYGEVDYNGVVTEENEINSLTAYARSKYQAEEYLINSDLSYTILRFAPVYDIDFLKDINKRTAYNKKYNFMLKIGRGENKFSFCHIENLKKSVEFLVENLNTTTNEIYNISDEQNYKAVDLLNNLKSFYNNDIRVFKVPKFLLKFSISILGIIKNDYEYYKSLYWKIAEDNIYSNQKIKDFGLNLDNNLYNLLNND